MSITKKDGTLNVRFLVLAICVFFFCYGIIASRHKTNIHSSRKHISIANYTSLVNSSISDKLGDKIFIPQTTSISKCSCNCHIRNGNINKYIWLTHHKGGSKVIQKQLQMEFIRICHGDNVFSSFSGRLHTTSADFFRHIFLMHFIRNPLSMILSGYNYAKQIPAPERGIDVLPFFRYGPFYCILQNESMNTLIKYCTYYNFTLPDDIIYGNYTLNQIYQILPTNLGLIFEYLSYSCSTFPEMKMWYDLTNRLSHAYNFQYELLFESDDSAEFTHSAQKLIDLHSDVVSFGECNQCKNDFIKKQLMKYDNSSEKNKISNSHITKGKYNKTYQIQTLLENKSICNDLKNKSTQSVMIGNILCIVENICFFL